jgi:hypothetical protein
MEKDKRKIKWGSRVYPTEEAIASDICNREEWGICLGHTNYYIRVVKCNRVSTHLYSYDFWTTKKEA